MSLMQACISDPFAMECEHLALHPICPVHLPTGLCMQEKHASNGKQRAEEMVKVELGYPEVFRLLNLPVLVTQLLMKEY